MSEVPADLKDSENHLWARPGAGVSRIRAGVTDFAQQSVGDVVSVSLPQPPELVNTDPYGEGWMFEVEADPETLGQQLASLLDARAYRDLAGA
jgi:glycine cleavage system H protein